jgi:hypothetical protein
MAFTGNEDPALTKEQTAICGLLAAVRWEDPDPTLWAPRTIIYPKLTVCLLSSSPAELLTITRNPPRGTHLIPTP